MESGRMSANLRPTDLACLSSSSVVRRSQNHLGSNKQNASSSIVTGSNNAVLQNHVPINKHSSLMFNHDPANSSILSAGQSQMNEIGLQMQGQVGGHNLNQQYFSS